MSDTQTTVYPKIMTMRELVQHLLDRPYSNLVHSNGRYWFAERDGITYVDTYQACMAKALDLVYEIPKAQRERLPGVCYRCRDLVNNKCADYYSQIETVRTLLERMLDHPRDALVFTDGQYWFANAIGEATYVDTEEAKLAIKLELLSAASPEENEGPGVAYHCTLATKPAP